VPDTVLHQLTTERGTYRLVSPRDGFAYMMQDSFKYGEIHRDEEGWNVVFYRMRIMPKTVANLARLLSEFEASYLARV
jgi:hypothetical protein